MSSDKIKTSNLFGKVSEKSVSSEENASREQILIRKIEELEKRHESSFNKISILEIEKEQYILALASFRAQLDDAEKEKQRFLEELKQLERQENSFLDFKHQAIDAMKELDSNLRSSEKSRDQLKNELEGLSEENRLMKAQIQSHNYFFQLLWYIVLRSHPNKSQLSSHSPYNLRSIDQMLRYFQVHHLLPARDIISSSSSLGFPAPPPSGPSESSTDRFLGEQWGVYKHIEELVAEGRTREAVNEAIGIVQHSHASDAFRNRLRNTVSTLRKVGKKVARFQNQMWMCAVEVAVLAECFFDMWKMLGEVEGIKLDIQDEHKKLGKLVSIVERLAEQLTKKEHNSTLNYSK